MGYFYIFGTILFTIAGQLLIKWQMAKAGQLPDPLGEKLLFILTCFINPFIVLGFVSALIAALCWMAAMTKYDLSEAYPFIGLTFIFLPICSALFLHEAITIHKMIGAGLIVAGIIASCPK